MSAEQFAAEQWQVEKLAEILRQSRNTVFFGGAGVSTESNIPDFRSANGLYHQGGDFPYPPETMLSRSFFLAHPAEFFAFYAQTLYPEAAPNAAHLALAKLEQSGRLRAVITQNIDGLHQAAGSEQVLELHGSIWRNICLNCGLRYPLALIQEALPGVPHCRDCGGIVRPDVVLYEEMLDQALLRRAQALVAAADTLVVGGTSLVVYPAAGLLADFQGRQLVLINQGATEYDERADLLIRAPIGATLAAALALWEDA